MLRANGYSFFRAMFAVALVALLTGCGAALERHMQKTSGEVMQSLSRNHTLPYQLEQDDAHMACSMAEATTPMMMAFGRVTTTPNQLGVTMSLSAGACAEERGRELEYAYQKHMRDRNVAQARDARYASHRHYRIAAKRYHRSWQYLNVHYGDVGQGDCPTEEFNDDLDEFIYLNGLLAGLQAMNAETKASQSLGVATNIPARVERAAQCLDDDKWWGAPMALRAAIWSMLPSTMPEGEDPFERLEEAGRKGEEAGVRLPHVMHAIAADNAGDNERVRRVIRRHAEAINENNAARHWVMVDENATLNILALSDRLWIENTGHRTPTGKLGTFWDDSAPEQEEEIDMEDFL